MGGNVERIKQRLDIAEVVSGYLKLDKAGINLKARCPFHNEKTPSFIVSPSRQSFYCFGCGAKGDMFTFVERMEGVEFKDALSMLADKAGIELERESRGTPRDKGLEERIAAALEVAAEFFVSELGKSAEASKYLKGRGISEESVKLWRIGYVPDEWRMLYSHLTALGFEKEIILKAGLAKVVEGKDSKEPYDTFRGRVMFPLFDPSGRVVAFSGRALLKDTEPKYLNSPDTLLFNKSELLYGLNRAKEDIRRKNYAVLVEGQMDMVLSHQAGVKNVVASSGTAFTTAHLARLRKLSPRIVLAFDGDDAGAKAAEKSAHEALRLGMEVKVAKLPIGSDPAELVRENPESWKSALRDSVPAVEHFLSEVIASEPDDRKRNKLIEKKVLPLIALHESAMERAHFVSLLSKRTGMREDAVWEDLSKVKAPAKDKVESGDVSAGRDVVKKTLKELIADELKEISELEPELIGDDKDREKLVEKKLELESRFMEENLSEERSKAHRELALAVAAKDDTNEIRLVKEIQDIDKRIEKLKLDRNIVK